MPPRPPLPEGVNSLQEFGKLIAWGTGDDDARARMRAISRADLESMHMTAEIAAIWRDFYREVKRRNPANPSAGGRAELMEHMRLLLVEGP